MIVLDASAALELLLNRPAAARLRARIEDPFETIHAPHLLDLEVLQVVARFVRTREVTVARAAEMLQDFRDLVIARYTHDLLFDRVWELRVNLTAYDAAYVALAELLNAPLLTADRRLARAKGHVASVEVIT